MGVLILIINLCTWWSSLDANYQTVIISSVVSVATLYLGLRKSERNRQRTKSIELTQYKQFIEEWITTSRKTLDQYISSLQKFSEDIINNKGLNIPEWTSNIIHFSEIYKIPLERYADIYIFGIDSKNQKERRKQLMNFLYQLEYLEKVPSLVMDIYNEYRKHSEEIIGECNNCYMALNMLYSKINYKDNPEAEHFYRLFKNAIDKSPKFSNLEDWKTEYIKPTKKIVEEKKPSQQSILFEIAIRTNDLNNVILKHYNDNNYSESFAGYAANLKDSLDSITNFKSYFEDKKIKRFCK